METASADGDAGHRSEGATLVAGGAGGGASADGADGALSSLAWTAARSSEAATVSTDSRLAARSRRVSHPSMASRSVGLRWAQGWRCAIPGRTGNGRGGPTGAPRKRSCRVCTPASLGWYARCSRPSGARVSEAASAAPLGVVTAASKRSRGSGLPEDVVVLIAMAVRTGRKSSGAGGGGSSATASACSEADDSVDATSVSGSAGLPASADASSRSRSVMGMAEKRYRWRWHRHRHVARPKLHVPTLRTPATQSTKAASYVGRARRPAADLSCPSCRGGHRWPTS